MAKFFIFELIKKSLCIFIEYGVWIDIKKTEFKYLL